MNLLKHQHPTIIGKSFSSKHVKKFFFYESFFAAKLAKKGGLADVEHYFIP